MQDYARRQAVVLLRRLAYQVGRAAHRDDAEAIHDLRVAIRRFLECLRIFDRMLVVRRIRRRLKEIMRAAAEVRDRDIARELLTSLGADSAAALKTLDGERRAARAELDRHLGIWQRRDLSRKWREQLEV